MNKYILAKRLVRYRSPLLVFAIILAIYGAGTISGIFTIPMLKTGDLFLRIKYKFASRPKNLDNIVIIGIDDASYYTYGKKWFWRRDIFADLVYKLKKNQPAVIGFDLVFVGESPVSGANDFLLAESFKDAGNIILGSYFDKDGRYILPYQCLKESALDYGFTNKPKDIDDVIRETRLFQTHALFKEEIIDYSLDLEIVSAFKGVLLKDVKFNEKENSFELPEEILKMPVPGNGIIPLNYTSRMSDFKVVSFDDIIHEAVPPEVIRNKIVLVGTTGEVFHDISLTPFGLMPGVGIIANTILMSLDNNLIYRIPTAINVLLLLLISFIVSIVTSKRVILYGTLLVSLILIGFIGVSLVLVINNISWDFFSVPVLILAIFLTNALTNYTNLLIQSLRIKKLVTTDILTGLPTRRYFLFKLDSALKGIREWEGISLVLFSVDNFQSIVSRGGIEKANLILKEIGELISKFSRKTRGVDFISRYGEVEFCCILYRTPEKGALIYANRIRQLLTTKVNVSPPLLVSCGIADVRQIKEKNAKLFVKCAEIALAKNRIEGGNKVSIYNSKVDGDPVMEYMGEREISEADLSYISEELKEKYKDMAILVNKLRTAQEEVIKAERLSAVGKAIAAIHHDISKPIVNIRSSLERIKYGLDKVDLPELANYKKFVISAAEETKRLEQMLEGLKDLYRPKEKEILPVSVNPIIEEMLNLSLGQIAEKDIKLIKNLDPNLPKVLADSSELKQVFLNLINNAIESMGEGGGLKIISLFSKDKDNMLEIQVIDTGCGIPPENFDRIYEAFFTTKKEEKGAGLGLYASQEIVKKYGGIIQVESIISKGSTFKVYLPFRKTRDSD